MHQVNGPTRSAHRGLTLVEVLLALAVLLGIVFLAWPVLSGAMSLSRLREASHEVRDQWVDARIQAMSSGRILAFRFEPESDVYLVEMLDDPLLSVGGELEGIKLGDRIDVERTEKRLPEGVRFQSVDVRQDERSEFLMPEGSDLTLAPPILFYPDGTTSTATLVLYNDSGYSVEVRLNGITGSARAGEPTKGQRGIEGAAEEELGKDRWEEF